MSAVWPALSEPVDPLDTFRWSVAMSANTRNGRVPSLEEVRQQYEASARADGPCAAINYETHRGE